MAEIDTKLIDVEGMPYTGKSTTAQFIADFLSDSGTNALRYDESDITHPADYSFHAFMKEDQIRSLAPDEQRQLYAEGAKKLSGLVIPLTKISVSLFGKIVPYKIYDNLEWETEKPVMLEHWLSFARKALPKNKTYVFNSCVLRKPISEMMMRLDFDYGTVRDYISCIFKMTAELRPVLIYLKCTHIKAHIEKEFRDRKSNWLDNVIEYHTSQGYGKRNGLTGFDGYIACLEERQKTELEILEALPIKKLILTDPFDDWSAARFQICEFLKKKSTVSVY